MITGSSVHNQGIEHLWQDMHRCAIKLFYRLFYCLKEQGVLDPDNDVHIYALHCIYVHSSCKPHTDSIQGRLELPLTEQDWSPNQLFVAGALRLQLSGLSALDFFKPVDSYNGIEEE